MDKNSDAPSGEEAQEHDRGAYPRIVNNMKLSAIRRVYRSVE